MLKTNGKETFLQYRLETDRRLLEKRRNQRLLKIMTMEKPPGSSKN
jgi:hypothetical protein